MSELKSKLALIKEKEQKLQEEKTAAIQEIKQRIGSMAERFHLLEESESLFAGLFLEASKALKDDKEQIKKWVAQGAAHLESKRKKSCGEATGKDKKSTQSKENSTKD